MRLELCLGSAAFNKKCLTNLLAFADSQAILTVHVYCTNMLSSSHVAGNEIA